MKITLLQENRAARPDMKPEHGLSVFLEKGSVKLLFDTGHVTGHFMDNAAALGVDLGTVTHVAFSHNHMDHTGGFPRFWHYYHDELGKSCPVYAGPDFFRVKYWDHSKHEPGEALYEPGLELVGPGFDAAFVIQNQVTGFRIFTGDLLELGDDVWLMGGLSSDRGFEEIDPTAAMEGPAGCGTLHDEFVDEQMIVVREVDGLTLLTGCAHNGVVNLIRKAEKRFGLPVKTVIGGTHLVAADAARTRTTIDWFVQKNIPRAYVCHCTGPVALEAFEKEVPGYRFAGAGTIIG